jgi:hypothetical protein
MQSITLEQAIAAARAVKAARGSAFRMPASVRASLEKRYLGSFGPVPSGSAPKKNRRSRKNSSE